MLPYWLRLVIFLAVALALFAPLNLIAVRTLRRLHPERRRLILAAVILGNALWPFMPFMMRGEGWMRVVRSTIGPLWFGWQCFVIVYCALLLIVLLTWLPARRRFPFASFACVPSRVFIAVALLGTLVGFYQAIVPLRVERVRVEIDSLAPELEGRRLVLLGDLHVGLFSRPSRLETIFSIARDLQPEAILIAGDFIDDDPYFVPKLLASTHVVPAELPIVAVLGNHELYGNPTETIARMRNQRIRLLVNEGLDLRGLWIAGISDPAAKQVAPKLLPDLDAALRGRPPAALPIVLAHQPRVFDDVARRGLPLALTAHTHGGQFGFRPLGWSLAGVFLKEHMGLYRRGSSQLYINTGTGYWLVPFRLGMTPEITLIELTRRQRG
jgi:predicted MPP superfamily phosphohydrolase